MTITIAAPLVCLVGLILFIWAEKTAPPQHPTAAKIAYAMFCAGLLVMLLQMGGEHGAKLW